jgi:hypothetical protein
VSASAYCLCETSLSVRHTFGRKPQGTSSMIPGIETLAAIIRWKLNLKLSNDDVMT